MEPGREFQEGKPGKMNPGAQLKGREPREGERRQGNQGWVTRGENSGRHLRSGTRGGNPEAGPRGKSRRRIQRGEEPRGRVHR